MNPGEDDKKKDNKTDQQKTTESTPSNKLGLTQRWTEDARIANEIRAEKFKQAFKL